MRILITEEALESGGGHWPSYIGDLARRFRAMGDTVDVLIHRDATPELVSRVGGTPWYSRNCWNDSRSQGKVGGLLHNWHFRRETMRFLRSQQPYDQVLALTMRMQHLLAYAVMSRSGKIPASTSFVLLFVQGFGQYAGPGVPTTFPKSFSSRTARIAFGALAPAVKSGRVILAGETAGMCDELHRFSGLPTTLFPHPVHLPGTELENESTSEEIGNKEVTESDKVLTVSAPGYARHEKGSDLLHDAILHILDQPWGNRLRFVLQWPEAFGMPGGGTMKPDSKLVTNDRVEFLNQSLDPAAYSALLDRSDLVILPYRSQSYHQRLSRVAIEAAGKGIPLVHTVHTWTQEVADLVGCGVPIQDESTDAIVEALRDAVSRYATIRSAAESGAGKVRSFHTADTFHKLFSSKTEGNQ